MNTAAEPKDEILRLLDDGRLTEARPLCQAWLDRTDDAHAWRILGVIAGREGDLPGAERCFREAVTRHPGDAKSWANLGHIQKKLGRPGEAAESYDRALAIEHTNNGLRLALVDILIDLGRLAEAEGQLKTALNHAPDDVQLLYNLGWVQQHRGQLKDAHQSYERVVALNPGHCLAMNNLGLLLLADAEYDRARALFERVLSLQPDFAPAWRNLGQVLIALVRLEEAVTALERAMQLGSDPAEAWSDIGRIRAMQGKNKEASECFEQALRVKPNIEAHHQPARPLICEQKWLLGKDRLHIGGREKREGWKLLNIRATEGIDFIGDIRDLSQFPDASFDVVYASHVLEHVGYRKELGDVVQSIHRILRTDGKFLVSVPDLDILCRLFVREEMTVDDRFFVMRMMFGGQVNEHDFHCVGLNADFLTNYLQQAGFQNVYRVPEFGVFNDTSSMRYRDVLISLNMIAVKGTSKN